MQYLPFPSLRAAKAHVAAEDARFRVQVERDERELETAELCRQFAALDITVLDSWSETKCTRSAPIPAWRARVRRGRA